VGTRRQLSTHIAAKCPSHQPIILQISGVQMVMQYGDKLGVQSKGLPPGALACELDPDRSASCAVV
jgi:hypothetical protein